MKIVILDGYSVNPGDKSWEPLRNYGEVAVYDRTAPGETLARIQGAEVVFTNKVCITKELMDRTPTLKCIIVMATGYNIVDTAAAAERGIAVCNAPGYSTFAVAQLTMAFLLEAALHVGEHSSAVHNRRWIEAPDFTFWDYPLVELEGKTLGIYGCGTIGRRVAALAAAFGMQVLGYRRSALPGTAEGPVRYVDRETLFSNSEYLTFHCPLNEESKGILCRETIEKLPRGAVVINTARGGIAVAEDVANALRSGRLGCYCADVIAAEPMAPQDPLCGAPNCILTPHLGWATSEARDRLLQMNEENLKAYLAGKPIHKVN